MFSILSRKNRDTISTGRSPTAMRATCLLLTLACAAAFAQDATPAMPAPYAQRLETLREKLFPNGLPVQPRHFLANQLAGETCSIPLLNAAPAGTPVKMPKVTPPRNQVDRLMPNSVPAPACPSNMAHVGAPAPALPPPATPPPGSPAPRKP
jgi:hypothetical protein